MKTLKKVEITPLFVEYMPSVSQMMEGVVYISRSFECAIHLCLCGCGQQTVMPLSKDGWVLTEPSPGVVSFSPSIANYQYPCNSHYIITRNIANFV